MMIVLEYIEWTDTGVAIWMYLVKAWAHVTCYQVGFCRADS